MGDYGAVDRLAATVPAGRRHSAAFASGLARRHAAGGATDAARQAFAAARAADSAARWFPQVGAAYLDEVCLVALPYRADRPAEREALLAQAFLTVVRARAAGLEKGGASPGWPPS